MARYTIDLDKELENKLKVFMDENKIDKRSVAIKKCILIGTEHDLDKSYITSFDERLNTVLYRLNINKKLLEQIFVNMDFIENNDISDNTLLKEIYENYKNKYFRRINNG